MPWASSRSVSSLPIHSLPQDAPPRRAPRTNTTDLHLNFPLNSPSLHAVMSFQPLTRRQQGWGLVLALMSLCLLMTALPQSTAIAANLKAAPPNADATSSIPGGSLEASERAGGHLLARHVGKSPEQLRQRLASDSHISAASSFKDRATADASIDTALKKQHTQIQSWLRGSEGRFVFSYKHPTPVGISVSRRATTPRDAYRIRMVLVRDKHFDEGWRILTGYPEL